MIRISTGVSNKANPYTARLSDLTLILLTKHVSNSFNGMRPPQGGERRATPTSFSTIASREFCVKPLSYTPHSYANKF